MEHTQIENELLEVATIEGTDTQLRELNDLQLAFVGGGSGDIVAA